MFFSSDEEYARRVQMQNEWVVRQVDNMQDYKQSLLFSLAANLEAEVSLGILCVFRGILVPLTVVCWSSHFGCFPNFGCFLIATPFHIGLFSYEDVSRYFL